MNAAAPRAYAPPAANSEILRSHLELQTQLEMMLRFYGDQLSKTCPALRSMVEDTMRHGEALRCAAYRYNPYEAAEPLVVRRLNADETEGGAI